MQDVLERWHSVCTHKQRKHVSLLVAEGVCAPEAKFLETLGKSNAGGCGLCFLDHGSLVSFP